MNMHAGRSLWALTLLIMAIGVAVALGRPPTSPSDEIKATSLTIVDGKGKERAFFGLRREDWQPELILSDADGEQRLRIKLDSESGDPFIELADGHGKIGILLSNDTVLRAAAPDSPSAGASIMISGKEGQGLLFLSTGTAEDRSFGRIELRDSRKGRIFIKPDDQ